MSVIDRDGLGAQAPPPYLFSTPGPRVGPLVTVTGDPDTALVEVGVHGRWSRRFGDEVSAAIGRCLAEPPAGIIADLHDLGDLMRPASRCGWPYGVPRVRCGRPCSSRCAYPPPRR
jgi:hypothetical protein